MAPMLPTIAIPADRRMLGPHPFHAVGEKYIVAVREAAGALPLLIPVLETPLQIAALLKNIDGIFLTGSPSNVEPSRYGGTPSEPGTLHDPHRDNTTLPLINAAVAAGVPLLAVCRGFQEMNVALGGTLWQKVQEVPGHNDHREDKTQPLEVQYAPAHHVTLEAGGLLARILEGIRQSGNGATREIPVNSLHSQGVRDLAPRLAVEARAGDGLIEAFRVRDARSFALGVQWHPEWLVLQNEFSHALFAAFGKAAREHAAQRAQEQHHGQ